MRRTEGLTIIEILIALTLLGILVASIISPIVSSFQLTQASRLSLDATTEAQRIVEDIRGQWLSRAIYDSNCAAITLKSNQTVTLQALNADGTVKTASLPFTKTGCPTAPTPNTSNCPVASDPMKRVTVTAKNPQDASRVLSRISYDVVCPRRE